MLEISSLHKSFGQESVLQDLSLVLPKHQTLSILGRSGSGKTTLMKIIAGLLQPDRGDIVMNGERITDHRPEKRNIVYLYQEALLFPHMTVFENIAFGLRLKNVEESSVQTQTASMLENLELKQHAQKKPHQLSGGQKQRVSFGRALIVNPALLLLDEPFGSLDVTTRESMQQFLRGMLKKFHTTSIFVTHDPKEAIRMGDRLGYMGNGKIHLFESISDFVQDSRTGVQKEIMFWEDLRNGGNQEKL